MSIGIDYLFRTGLAREFLTTPCSIFVTKCFNGEKLAFNITKSPNNLFFVKKWNIFDCSCDAVLPPFEEFESSDVFEDDRIVSEEYKLFDFRHKGFPTSENAYNHPMPNEKFNEYFDGHFSNYANHNFRKESWLWFTFLEIYQPQLINVASVIKRSLRFYGKLAERELLNDQKTILQTNHPKLWKIWLVWKKHLLDFNGVPGEFVFKYSFLKKELELCSEE